VPPLALFGRKVYFGQVCVRKSISLLVDGSYYSTSVLTRIRQLMFNFLWSGSGAKDQIHLCNWEFISKPKPQGGWGIKNLPLFSRALAVNTLWCCLMKDDLWHKVLLDKYLPSISVVAWLRSTSKQSHNVSIFWRSLVKSVEVITQWLAWNPGSGHSIRIGEDMILGLNTGSWLSPSLITTLKRKVYIIYIRLEV
jgi:hypothetical protein